MTYVTNFKIVTAILIIRKPLCLKGFFRSSDYLQVSNFATAKVGHEACFQEYKMTQHL